MEVVNLFTDFFLQDRIDYDYDSIINYINSGNCEVNSTKHSIRNGWQTPKYKEACLVPYGNLINIAIEKIQEEFPCKLKLLNFWLNVNPTGSYNALHRHPSSQLSGVIYINVPFDSNAAINFEREGYHESYEISRLYPNTDNQYFGSYFSYVPKQGDCLVFPSYLLHSVDANQSKETRISLSFNLGIDQ